jgi:hypothetical protein
MKLLLGEDGEVANENREKHPRTSLQNDAVTLAVSS